MMARTFLDVESARDQARAQLAEASRRIDSDPVGEAAREHARLTDMGFAEADAASIVAAIQRTPLLSFARAVLADPRILILDDATQQHRYPPRAADPRGAR